MNVPAWVVKEVQPQNDYTLIITFADGTKKYIMLDICWIRLYMQNSETLHFF